MKLALRIEVATWRGLRLGVPRLLGLLEQHGATATFLFNLGHDTSGRAARHTLPTGGRLPALRHYGLSTLMAGFLLPGPSMGRRGADLMKQTVARGHEAGVHAWDRREWISRVADDDAGGRWTENRMRRAHERYRLIFGEAPQAHGAPGWRMNRHAWRLTQRLGYAYASDTRGKQPFIPLNAGEIIACPQIPTTLPTLDELAAEGATPDAWVAQLLSAGSAPAAAGHVYTLRAEIEGGVYAPLFGELLAGWRAQGHTPCTLREYFSDIDPASLPRCTLGELLPDMHAAPLAAQGGEFLAR